MQAIRVAAFGPPHVLELQSHALPALGAGQVRVRIEAIGVNPVETYLRSGSNPALPLPYTPGTDVSGVVEEVGAGVTRCQSGDRVYTSGTLTGAYAQACLCAEVSVHRIPSRITFGQGAALGVPYGTAWRALHQRAAAKPGETLLIHGGSGGVGLAAIQMARHHGMEVIATAGTPAGRAAALSHGAHHVLDHTAPDYWAELPRLGSGRPPDIILEMLSNVNLGLDAKLIGPRGRIIVIGSRGPVEINARDLMIREADIRGLFLFSATLEEKVEIYAGLGVGLSAGWIDPVVGRSFPLSAAAAAHEAVLASGAMGKIILTP
jgi:NADPH:quinone reductase